MATAAASPHVQSKSSPTLGRPAPPRRTTGLAVAVGGSGVFVAVAAPGVAVGLKIMVTTGGLVSVGVGVFVGVAVGPACDRPANVAVGALKMTVVSSHAHHETTNKERLTATGP